MNPKLSSAISTLLTMAFIASSPSVFASANNSFSKATKIKFPLPLEGSTLSVAEINKQLKKAGKAQVPATVTIDLTKPANDLNQEYWNLSDLIESVHGAGILTSVPDKGACFIGINTEVAKNMEKLTDGWLSEQFGVSALAISKPNHLGIKYHVTDDGDDVNWLNMERCK